MKKIFLILGFLISAFISFSQTRDYRRFDTTYFIGEVNIQNHTKDSLHSVLRNKGGGRTEFIRTVQQINDSIWLIAGDTLKVVPGSGGSGNNIYNHSDSTTDIYRRIHIRDDGLIEFHASGLDADSIITEMSGTTWKALWLKGGSATGFAFTKDAAELESFNVTNHGGRFMIDGFNLLNGAVYTDFDVSPTGIKYAGHNYVTSALSLTTKEYVDGAIVTDAVINNGGAPSLMEDIFANIPGAGNVGDLFLATDTGKFYRWNGSAWILLNLAGIPSLDQVTQVGNITRNTLRISNGSDTTIYYGGFGAFLDGHTDQAMLQLTDGTNNTFPPHVTNYYVDSITVRGNNLWYPPAADLTGEDTIATYNWVRTNSVGGNLSNADLNWNNNHSSNGQHFQQDLTNFQEFNIYTRGSTTADSAATLFIQSDDGSNPLIQLKASTDNGVTGTILNVGGDGIFTVVGSNTAGDHHITFNMDPTDPSTFWQFSKNGGYNTQIDMTDVGLLFQRHQNSVYNQMIQFTDGLAQMRSQLSISDSVASFYLNNNPGSTMAFGAKATDDDNTHYSAIQGVGQAELTLEASIDAGTNVGKIDVQGSFVQLMGGLPGGSGTGYVNAASNDVSLQLNNSRGGFMLFDIGDATDSTWKWVAQESGIQQRILMSPSELKYQLFNYNATSVGDYLGMADPTTGAMRWFPKTSHSLVFTGLLYNIDDTTAAMGHNPAIEDTHLNMQNAFGFYLDSLAAGLFLSELTIQSIDTAKKVLTWDPVSKKMEPMYWPATGGGGGAIGSAITGGTAGRFLYLGTGGILEQAPFYDSAGKKLEIGGGTSPAYTITADGQLGAVSGSSFIYSDPAFPGNLAWKAFNNGVGDWRIYLTGNGSGGNLAFEFKNTNSTLRSSIIASEFIGGTPTLDQSVYGGVLNWPVMRYTSGNNQFNYWQEAGARNVFGFGFPTGQDYTDFRMNGATSVTTGSLVLRMHDTQKMEAPGSISVGSTNSATSTIQTLSFAANIASSAVDVTLDATNFTMLLTATGKTATLPTAVGIKDRVYIIKLTASGTGTVATTSGQTIDGASTYPLASQNKSVMVQSDNSNWVVIMNNGMNEWIMAGLVIGLFVKRRKIKTAA